jgi:hypothetical protein
LILSQAATLAWPALSCENDLNQSKGCRGRRKNISDRPGAILTAPTLKKPVLAIGEPGAAEASGRKLKSTYPMLQIEIYEAATKVRTLSSQET